MFRSKKFRAAVVLISAAALTFILYYFDPTKLRYYPPCYFHYITGYYCPGCGGIRGTHFLLNGNIIEAIKSNLLIFTFIPLITYYLITRFVLLIFNKNLSTFNPPLWLVMVFVIIILLYWILRNIPVYPFNLLVPPY
ncbi:MAG: DUF2752 domain-containing protein [Ignavibacteria bacterium]|nr:DUF2752 domain-containing protein [Ignavibacteria bacterium]